MDVFKRSVIIDIDGTLYDKFSRDDRNIIVKIFEDNIIVKLIDKFLWSINSLDFFSNPMRILKLRLKIYSMFSFKRYERIEKEYKHRYQRLLRLDLESKEKVLKEINETYNIILVTNNIYAMNILYKYSNYDIIYSADVTSRRKQIKEYDYYGNINYIIGNNYTDDIFLAKKINVSSIYVGDSIFKKKFKADFNVLSFLEAVEILKR
jgi:hypothetical protein